MGARGRRPLWSPPWVPVTFGHCFLFFLIFYSLFFTALDALPCPAPSPALAPALAPAPALFRIFLLLPGTGRGSYTGNGQFFFSFCCQGQEEEVIQGTGRFFFPFAAKDRRRKLHRERMGFRTWTDRHSGVRSVVALPHRCHRLFFFFFFPHGRFYAFGFRDSWRWSQVRRFACGRDGWNVHPAGWMTVRAGGRNQGLLHLHPQKYTGAESGVASPKAFIYRWLSGAIY